ncbi:reticulon-4-like isoform X2 [Mercenaria mercenaria]|uniref:reticulon-4-like isoform X2 n=1 Tax=Mercenaria mercenaria TaxID=6596 RepID=UPI00234F71BF|nr:reticulon-4-like isoform X2 [Mercenaria mercenaria]
MSENFGVEEFEKVDAVVDQDENVTSTSLTGEEAEEDRYTGSAAPNDVDLLGDFLASAPAPSSNEPGASENLGSFGSNVYTAPEPMSEFTPTQETVITEPVSESKATVQAEGGWMKTVDPRDDISEMEEPSPSNTEEISSAESAESPTQLKVNGESVGITNTFSKEKLESGSDSSSIVSSSDNEYSSSADESDTESSDSAPVSLHVTKRQITEENNGFIGDSDNTNQLNVSHSRSEINIDDIELLSVNQGAFGLLQLDKEMDVNEETQGEVTTEMMTSKDSDNVSEQQAGPDAWMKHGKDFEEKETVDEVKGEVKPLDFDGDPGGAAVNVIDDNVGPVDNKVGLSETDMLDIIDKLTKDDDADEQSPELESDMSFGNLNENKSARDIEFEKFIRGEEVLSVDNISPVVSDNECNSIENNSSSSHSNSGSEDEISCTDSDLSGDEGAIGTWSPSPLYSKSFGDFDEEEEIENEEMDVEEKNNNVLVGYEYFGADSVNTSGGQQENELSSLRADVKGLMEEMEAMVQETDSDSDKRRSGEFIDAMVADIDKTVEGANVEESEPIVPRNEPLISIMATGTRERSKTPENDLLHVKFQTPTNTLFYDPDCPIVEKVSMEISDDLIDHEEEEKNLEDVEINQDSPQSEDLNLENVEELEAKVVKDLKEVYNNLEAKGEIEGAMDLLRESGITNMDDIALQFANKVLEQARNEHLAGKTQTDIIQKQDGNENEQQINKDVETTLEALQQDKNETQDQNRVDVENEFISEDIITAEVKEKVSVNPFKTSEPEDLKNNDSISTLHPVVDTISEKETKSQLLGEKDEITGETDSVYSKELNDTPSFKEDASEIEVEEPVIMRRKKVNRVEAESPVEIDSMIIHDIDNLSERDIQSMVIHDIGESKLHDVISTLEREHDEILVHTKIGLDEVEVRHRRLSESIEEQEHIMESVSESKLSEENVIEQESENLFQENFEKEKIVDDVIDDKNVELEPTENSEVKHEEDLEKEEHRLFIMERATQLMKMILSEVLDLIYWRDVKKTGVVFGSMMFILLSLTFFTILSVLAYLSLAILTVTLSFRVYKNVMQAVQKTNEGHPFKKLLELDISLQSDVVESAADKIATNVNNCSKELRRLFLVEDYVDSLKFGLLLWLLTYVGSWFNGMTLVILAVVCIFTLPKVYETYQGPIDQNVNLVRGQLNNIMTQVSSKIPFPKKKAKTQ